MRKQIARRLLASLLALVMVIGLTPAAFARDDDGGGLTWEEVSNDSVTASPERREAAEPKTPSPYADDEQVRVSIVLEGEPTIAMFDLEGIAENEDAIAYREMLEECQEAAAEYISEEALGGGKLDVVSNLTLAANIISANVEYGKIEDIKALDGIEDVFVEPVFRMQDSQTEADPQMVISTGYAGTPGMTNTVEAWEKGYKGQGMRIAIIDSGLDFDHESFDSGAFLYALEEDAEADGKTVADYNLLDAAELERVFSQLHVSKRDSQTFNADDLYHSEKVPFAYNYRDKNYFADHMHDYQGNHGTQVAGTAAANRYIPDGEGGYDVALETVYTSGHAPDAQLIVMKVFGAGGGAYASDYALAIEDAAILGCTAANLSIGSIAGFSTPSYSGYKQYQVIYDNLAKGGMVVSVAGCNYGYWAEGTYLYDLYSEDVNFHTAGEPGTYPNSFSVANGHLNGQVGIKYPEAGGVSFDYRDATSGNNEPLSSLGEGGEGSTEYGYVFFEGYGALDDYAGIDVAGKVVFVSRGGGNDEDSGGHRIGNFSTKAYNAITANHAAAVIVYNHTANDGATSIGLSYDDVYTGTAPVAGISKENADKIRAASQPMTGHSGVYTGTIAIYGNVVVNTDPDAAMLINETSSWGVTGDLLLKPEITAPASYLWMTDGAYNGGGGHDQYVSSYGTSFAAPQIAGISALVQQYINDKGLSQPGLTDRALIQSLLMSTAVPMKDANGNYYSVMQQGSGMVDTGAATRADSYILMGSDATGTWKDGKVKVELGDDAGRTGSYSFTFTINNLDNTVRSYALGADVFTQATGEYWGYTTLSTSTEFLKGAKAAFEVLNSSGGLCYDFDGSGAVNLNDGSALLDFVTGNRSSLYYQENAGFDRGVIDSYSGHQFLKALDMMTESVDGSVTVPAGGSVTIRATITLDESEMNRILKDRWNGAYVEAFVTIDAKPDLEGAVGTSHSIPVLGFYGNWTDPSMFDKNSYSEYVYDTWWEVPYLYGENGNTDWYYTGDYDDDGNAEWAYAEYSSYLTVNYANGITGYMGANPFYGLVEDEYLEARNALNNENGDMLGSWYYTLIRNAAVRRLLIEDVETGAAYKAVRWSSFADAAYYEYDNGWYWANPSTSTKIEWDGTDRDGNKLPENTTVEVTVFAAPELYADEDKNVDWNALGDGAKLTTRVTIDNTAPALVRSESSFDPETGDLTVTFNDNQFVSAVYLATGDGETWLDSATPSQTEKGANVTVTLNIGSAKGQVFLVQVYDYACNTRTYEVTVGASPDTPEMEVRYSGYNYNSDAWGVYSKDGTWTKTADGNSAWFTAGAYCNGKIYAFDYYNDFFVMDADNLNSPTKIGSIAEVTNNGGYFVDHVADMAYDKVSDTMYFAYVYYKGDNPWYGLGTVNLSTGEVTNFYDTGYAYYAIAVDDNGTLYGLNCYYYSGYPYGYLYTIGWDESGELEENYVGSDDNWGWIDNFEDWYAYDEGYYSMTWDSEEAVLVLAANDFYDWAAGRYVNKLFTIDPAEEELYATDLGIATNYLVALYTQYVEVEPLEPTDEVESVSLPSSLTMVIDSTQKLTATLLPENLSNQSVTWTSSDPSVVKVTPSGPITEGGWERPVATLTAVSAGTATVTATSTVDKTKSAACEVTVTSPSIDLQALMTDSDGNTSLVSFNTQDLTEITNVAKLMDAEDEAPLISVAEADDGLYAISMEGYYSSLYTIENNTAKWKAWLEYEEYAYYMYDFAYAPSSGCFIGIDDYGGLYPIGKDGTILDDAYWPYYYGNHFLTAITYAGTDGWGDDYFIIIDSDGCVFLDYAGYDDEYGIWCGYWYNSNGTDYSYHLGSTGYKSNSSYYHSSVALAEDNEGDLYLLWTTSEGKLIAMTVDWENYKIDSVCDLGSFPAGMKVSGLMAVNPPEEMPVQTAQAAQPERAHRTEDGRSEAPRNIAVKPGKGVEANKIPADMLGTEEANDTETMSASVTDDSVANSVVSVTGDTATVQVVLDAASTNGKLKISYDASKLTLTGTSGKATINSFCNDEDGTVVFAYAYKDAVEAGTVVAELTFTCRDSCTTAVTVTTLEDGETKLDDSTTVYLTFGNPYNPAPAPVSPGPGPGITTPTKPTPKPSEDDTKPGEEDTTPGEDDNKPGDDTPAPAQPVTELFDDLEEGKWYIPYVQYVVDNGLMGGVGNGSFAPNEALSRAMLVTILYRAAGTPGVSGTNAFSDVAAGSWYDASVAWASLNGIVNGYSDGTFQPNKSITRQELAVILWRYAQFIGLDVSANGTTIPDFTDRDEIASWAGEAMSWAYSRGILAGSGNQLNPGAGATRAEAAAMLTRFLQLVANSALPTE